MKVRRLLVVIGFILTLLAFIIIAAWLIVRFDPTRVAIFSIPVFLIGLILVWLGKHQADLGKPSRFHNLLNGYRSTALLYIGAKLGLADLLADGPRSSAELAGLLRADIPSLHRVLRGLVAIGVCAEEPDGRFVLTGPGVWLQTNKPGSLRGLAIITGEECMPAWGGLFHSAFTGETAFEKLFGMSQWEHRRRDRELNGYFNAWLGALTEETAGAIMAAYDFSPFDTIIDIGGGYGALLGRILGVNPALNGILFDQPHVVAEAPTYLKAIGVTDRCQVIGGNFFEAVPDGADVCILKSVIHDWDDKQSLAILTNCRSALKEQGKILLIERIMPERVEQDPQAILTDLHMLALTGGRQRTESEIRNLCEEAGFRSVRFIPTRSTINIVEAVRV